MTWIASLDGRYKQKLRMEPGAQKYIRSLCNVPREERPFIFSQLEVSDASHDNPPHLDKLGWIEVVACRVKVTGAPPHSRTRRVSLPPEIGPLPERSKKDGWHAVALGKARASKHRAAPPVKYLDSWDKPFAKFCFRYQPAGEHESGAIFEPGPSNDPCGEHSCGRTASCRPA
ncbi:hypothetical protein FA95DRAFT_1565997 [Auriscalpium vulgare]|uniref:Uncharacterized protein n=1 Tax=Auriscalpium vulgare TaxID=40419 RepID=A0ACB8R9S7_9AGAM|nr:hypothetical protein FA95DRAFT_1565997 [Auriscalpium vulgare]